MARSNTPRMCFRPRKFIQSPCYGCEGRTVGCHSTCDKYKDFRNETAKDFQKRKETYQAEVAAETFCIEQKMKSLRRHGKR